MHGESSGGEFRNFEADILLAGLKGGGSLRPEGAGLSLRQYKHRMNSTAVLLPAVKMR
jgi:hypothetical protein